MDTIAIIARLREHAATHDAANSWSLCRAAADDLERLHKLEMIVATVRTEMAEVCAVWPVAAGNALEGLFAEQAP
jgi:hypothetical protein